MSLALDTTGTAADNRIEGEAIAITPSSLNTFGCVFLEHSPFFGTDLTVTYNPSDPNGVTRSLVLGTDYNFDFELPGFGDADDVTTRVWGALNIFNQGLDGTLTVSYQALGGKWTFDHQAIRNYLNSTMFNSNFQFRALVPRDPLHLPNNPNAEWPLNSINAITIAQAQLVSGVTLSVEFLQLNGESINDVRQVVVLDAPLPLDAARESGNLKVIADAQGQAATGVNQMTGGLGLLGWLSGLYANAVSMLAKLTAIDTKLAQPLLAKQNGVWNVGLSAGTQAIGSVVSTALSSIVDYASTPGYAYICEALPGTAQTAAGWRICKMDLTTGSITWAGGVGDFTQVATNRSSLTYS